MKTQRRIPVITLLILLLLVPALIRADDDGGGRSVFARGAGERALALGGAHGAVAEGPTAMFWNPAGLGRLERTTFNASHTSLIGLGFYEQFGAVALPTENLGTFGLALRRFGVDGIEGRDDRGALTDENLEDAETELSLGYGRTLGEAWRVGAVVKLQSQELAGQSGNGLGLDLGVQTQPLRLTGDESALAQALSLGLTLRNVVEPTIRLAQEDVKDPSSIRLGAAADFAMADNVEVVLAADVDKTSDMDMKVHLGAEVRLLGMLAVRAGSNAGDLAAGAGVRWRNLTVNYAFEDNPLESVHRFGVGVALGTSVTERRQAALQRQEEDLRQRLDRAFAASNESRLERMSAECRQALAEGDYALALQHATTIRVLDPDNPDVADAEAAAYLGQARDAVTAGDLAAASIAYRRCLAAVPGHAEAQLGLDRLNEESQRQAQRTEVIRAHFEDGLARYAESDLLGAREAFTRVLELDPQDVEARSLLTTTETTLRLRTASLAEQAAALVAAGRYDEARGVLDQLRELAPQHAALARVSDQITRAETQASRTASSRTEATRTATTTARQSVAPAPKKPSFDDLSAQRRSEIEDLYRRGVAAIDDGRRDDAISYWELVWNAAPDYQQVSEYLKQEYLASGMEAFAAGQLDLAIEIWEKALDIDPDDARTQGYLGRAYEHKARIREIRSSTS